MSGSSWSIASLNRLEEPSAGRVLLDGVDIRQLDPRRLRRRVGMVFQTPVLFAHTVRDNLVYNLGEHDEAVLLRALDAAQLPPAFLGRETNALSVGEAQRVTIARRWSAGQRCCCWTSRPPHSTRMPGPASRRSSAS